MKRFIFVLVVLFSCVNFCLAGDFEVEVNKFGFGSETYSHLKQQIPQLKVKYNFDNDLYVFLAGEKDQLSLVGQLSYDIYLVGAGAGYTYRFNEHFSLFGDVGYYYPIYEPYGTSGEGQRYYMNAKVKGSAEAQDGIYWEEYSVDDVVGGFGGVLGIKYTHKRFSAQIGYRYLSMDVLYLGESPSKGHIKGADIGWWQLDETQNYGGGFIGFTWGF